MSAVIPAATRTKLARVLALLGSDEPGERDAAGFVAHRMLTKAGLTWEQLLVAPHVKREPGVSTWRATCAALVQRSGDLRAWERRFVADLPAFPRISTKQRYILAEIASRVLQERTP